LIDSNLVVPYKKKNLKRVTLLSSVLVGGAHTIHTLPIHVFLIRLPVVSILRVNGVETSAKRKQEIKDCINASLAP